MKGLEVVLVPLVHLKFTSSALGLPMLSIPLPLPPPREAQTR